MAIIEIHRPDKNPLMLNNVILFFIWLTTSITGHMGQVVRFNGSLANRKWKEQLSGTSRTEAELNIF
jgi:hypothetical protein